MNIGKYVKPYSETKHRMKTLRKTSKKIYFLVFHTDEILRGRIPRPKYTPRSRYAEIFNSIGKEEPKVDKLAVAGYCLIAAGSIFILCRLTIL